MGNPDLKTVCFWPGWDRTVYIYVERKDGISGNINDDDTCKIVLIEKGELEVSDNTGDKKIKAPALLLLSNKDKINIKEFKKSHITTVYFKPSVIREEFEYRNIKPEKIKADRSKTIFHDYFLICLFFEGFPLADRAFDITLNEFNKLKELIGSMEKQLALQEDGFWPCRSRSFLLEILYFISYSCAGNPLIENTENEENADFKKMTNFLNEHINEPITQERLTKEFSINRNKLNEIFVKETSMTALNYLTKIRMELAGTMLANTQITVNEISSRVGFQDANYFARTFKKQMGMSPSEYRKK